MCECLTKSIENLRKKYDDPEGEFNTTGSINFKTGKARTSWPYLKFSYRRKKKDGNYMKNREYVNIIPNYCPICGTEYEK